MAIVSNQTKDIVQQEMLAEIRTVMNDARSHLARQVNQTLLAAYWNIGRVIVEHEQNQNVRAEYGKEVLKQVSRTLTKEFGKGFSVSNLQFMRRFYQAHPIQQTVSVKLSWSHYCELLVISDEKRRGFYEKECERSNWSVRELKRQISTSLFERLLLSDGDANKEKVYALATQGQEIAKPEDIIKDPYVFEFLGLPDQQPVMESELGTKKLFDSGYIREVNHHVKVCFLGLRIGKLLSVRNCSDLTPAAIAATPLPLGEGILVRLRSP